jgi:2-succinyl-5-enolpyruvyl-6-hydroxy-3-cyclohexene-1-carboxylate synthase
MEEEESSEFYPGHEEKPVFNTYFETSHHLTAEHLAKMYQFEYLTASDTESLKTGIDNLYSQKWQTCHFRNFYTDY